MGLITVEQLETYLGIDLDDAQAQALIDNASAMIEAFTKTVFEQRTITETDDGGGLDLIMSHKPIISVTSVTDFGQDVPVLVDATEYTVYLEEGFIRALPRGRGFNPWTPSKYPHEAPFFNGFWAIGAKRWEIVYEAGYATVPLDIQQAALMLCAYLRSTAGSSGGAYQSETIGDYSYTLGSVASGSGGQFGGIGAQFPPSVLAILRRYLDVSF